MHLNRLSQDFTGRILGGIAAFAGIAAVSVGIARPQVARAALEAFATVVHCGTSTGCVVGNNSTSGPGVSGSSFGGAGVVGQGPIGVRGNGTSNYGVTGVSTGTYGVYGTSTNGQAGVAGSTAGKYGVYGYTTGTSVGEVGVYGKSTNGFGLYGTSGAGVGLAGYVGSSPGGIGVYGQSDGGSAVEGLGINGGWGSYFQGVGNGAAAVVAQAYNGNGNGIVASSDASGYPLLVTDLPGDEVFSVDSLGDVLYHGTLYNFARVNGGVSVKSFSATTSQPTVEDTGSGQLVSGTAAVRLDATFAASIDMSTPYRVFLTPQGDSRGLYIASKSTTGFVVRESQGGRSTLAFDYRIVAAKFGAAGQRMAIATVPRPRFALMAKRKLPLRP